MFDLEKFLENDKLVIGGKEFKSRLIVGSGKYKDFQQTKEATEASGAEMITVAVRRVNITDPNQDNLLNYIDTSKIMILPNTAGCYTAEEAVLTAKLAREALGHGFVKLEVIGDQKTLYPDMIETLKAAEILVKEGFTVLPYITDDPVMAKRFEDIGCAAVMPLAAPIGSGLGLQNPYNILFIKEAVKIPVIVDAGIGTASDAAIVMELGVDGVLMNTAIAQAKDPIKMAVAMKHAVIAGRLAYLAGRIPKKMYASASSPMEGVIGRN
ncbi:thiazole synthase [Sulfurihydrogenibium yellowstonense]|jgi:thiazole synthase|uniref:Thiazole synthase n=1 Tax=Sulfurihydrogenibium yellowstonense SS-5 TaxID=432331 RepID=C4FJ24_9AQUI|nr:thiazole synthase [Sulfurihydrogenibium yellowstonense]EEP60925.1 thiazole biosynthesis protein ThiG [Sulfurihydrogenibium yellowstonense SS-5]